MQGQKVELFRIIVSMFWREPARQAGRYASTSCSVNRWGGDPRAQKLDPEKSIISGSSLLTQKIHYFRLICPIEVGGGGGLIRVRGVAKSL